MQSVEHDLTQYPFTIGRVGDKRVLWHVPSNTYYPEISAEIDLGGFVRHLNYSRVDPDDVQALSLIVDASGFLHG